MKLMIFVPCYNCEKQISRVLIKLSQVCQDSQFKIVVIDNVSRDRTAEVARKTADGLGLDCDVLRNRLNVGLGGSHKVAFAYAIQNSFTHVLVLHGDDQAHVEDIKRLIDLSQKDAVLGARFMWGSSLRGYSKFRIFGNAVFNLIFSFISRRWIFDLGSGLNLYSIDLIREKFYTKYPNDLTFNCALLLGSISKNFKMEFVPITWTEEDQVSNVKLFSQSMNTLKMATKFLLFGEKRLESDAYIINPDNYEVLAHGN